MNTRNTRLDLTNATDEQRGLVSQFLLGFGGKKTYIIKDSQFSLENSDDTYQFAQPLLLKTPNLTKLTLKPLYPYPQYYVVGDTLGKGAYGAVASVGYKIKLTDTGYELKEYKAPYVIKIMLFKISDTSEKREEDQIESWKNHIYREYDLIKSQKALHGKNLAFSRKGKSAFFLMRRIPGVTLYEWMKSNPQATPPQRNAITQALLDAYDKQLYDQCIVHTDIKPLNIILDEVEGVYHATFIDYGFAVKVEDMESGYEISSVWGTPFYIAPQLYHGRLLCRCKYNAGTDIWSLVVVLSEFWGLNLNKFNRSKQERVPLEIADAIIACETLPVALRDYVARAKNQGFIVKNSKDVLFSALRSETGLSTEPSPDQAEAFKAAELPQSSYAFEGLMTGLVLTLAIGLAATIIVLTHGAAAIFLLTAFSVLSTTVTLPGSIGLLIAAGSVLPIIGGLIGKRISQAPSPTLFAVSTSKQSSSSVSSSVASTLKLST